MVAANTVAVRWLAERLASLLAKIDLPHPPPLSCRNNRLEADELSSHFWAMIFYTIRGSLGLLWRFKCL